MPANYAFVDDITIPDNITLATGTPFVKTWRLRNNGDVPWGDGYTLRFSDGDAMTTRSQVPLPPAAMASGVISLRDKYGYDGQPLWKAIQQGIFYR